MSDAREIDAGIWHLRCGNPGPMTLTGTNTYVLTVGADRVVVIDPGPQDAVQRAAILARVEGAAHLDVLLTHHHDDHEGGATALVDELRTREVDVDSWGGATGKPLLDGGMFGDLQVVAAPGHTADSVAYLLVRGDDVILFSGDTLLGGSSSFIAHPDGDLTAYLGTLDVLDALLEPWPQARLAPGHGEVGGPALPVIQAYRAHRAERLDEVRQALTALGDEGADDSRRVNAVVDRVYAGLDPALRPAIEAIVRAQLAHLDRVGSAGTGCV